MPSRRVYRILPQTTYGVKFNKTPSPATLSLQEIGLAKSSSHRLVGQTSLMDVKACGQTGIALQRFQTVGGQGLNVRQGRMTERQRRRSGRR